MSLQLQFGKESKTRGAALLTVLVALLLISLMTLELQYTSLVERKLAYNDLNKIQTHYLSKSGVRLALLRLGAFGKITNNPGRFKAVQQYFSLIWNIPFPPYPPQKAALDKLSLQEKSEQLEALKDTRITNGQFSYSISAENSKLNLNLLSNAAGTGFRSLPGSGPGALGGFIGFTLQNKITEIFRESESPVDEFGNVKPEEIVENILEWISPLGKSSARDNTGWYERQDPPYRPKHGRFFTVDEVKLVKDISPSLFLKLKPFITVFSEEGKVNLDESTQSGKLKLYFPRMSDYALKLINEQYAKLLAGGGQGWGSVTNFFQFLESVDPASASEYQTNVRDEFFSVENGLFLIRSKGSIQKSGSTIESSLTVAVAFDPPRYRTPFPNYTDETQCENRAGNYDRGVWLGGRCVHPPFSAQECEEEGLTLCAGGLSCQALRDGGIGPCFQFPKRTPNGPPLWGGLKIYSWVES